MHGIHLSHRQQHCVDIYGLGSGDIDDGGGPEALMMAGWAGGQWQG